MGLKIGVIGPAGFGGSYLCVELINRGHTIIGFSRRPETLGKHDAYVPYSIDIEKCPSKQLIDAFNGLDVLVNEYGPHTSGEHALQYRKRPMPIPPVTKGRSLTYWPFGEDVLCYVDDS